MVSTKRVALLAVVLIAVLGALALFSLTVGMRAITLSGVLHALRSAGIRSRRTSSSGRCACHASWRRSSAA